MASESEMRSTPGFGLVTGDSYNRDQDSLRAISRRMGSSISGVISGFGNVFYVDATSGSNSNAGTRDAPFLTITYAISQASANRDDVIVLLRGDFDEVVTVNVAGVHVIGAGWERVSITRTGAAAAIVSVTAADVEIAGVRVLGIGGQPGIRCTAARPYVHDCLILGGGTFGIEISNASGAVFRGALLERNIIRNFATAGIEVSGANGWTQAVIKENEVFGSDDSFIGVRLNGDAQDENFVHHNRLIAASTAATTTGISIVAGDENLVYANAIAGFVTPMADTGTGNRFVGAGGTALAVGATETTASFALPDVAGTNRDFFDGGAAITNQAPSAWDADWQAGFAEVHAFIDLRNMIAGDTIIVEFLKEVTATNFQVQSTSTFAGLQAEPVKEFTLRVTTAGRIQGRVRQTAGVARTVISRSSAFGGNRG